VKGIKMRKVTLFAPREEVPTLYYFAPLGLLSISSLLEKEGYELRIIDAKLEPNFMEEVLESVKDSLCLWVSGKTGKQFQDLILVAKAVKEEYPHIPIVWGGWHVSLAPEKVIRSPYADMVVRRQGEITFWELVHHLEKRLPLDSILGLTFKRDGRIITNPDRPLKNLNEFPPLPYHLIPLERYISRNEGRGKPLLHNSPRAINYTSSRGCYGKCGFCHITALFERKWMGLSAERVLNDIQFLVEKHRID